MDQQGPTPQTHTQHKVLSPTGFVLGFVHPVVNAEQAGVPSRSSAAATSDPQDSPQQLSPLTSGASSDSVAKSAQHASTSQQQPSSAMSQQHDPRSTSQQESSSPYSSSSQQTAAEASLQQPASSSSTGGKQDLASQHTGQMPAILRDHADSQRAQQDFADSNQHDPAQHASGLMPRRAARSAAVKLLIAFMGALQASQYAVDAFVNCTLQCYRYVGLHYVAHSNLSWESWCKAEY